MPDGKAELIYIGGKEGVKVFSFGKNGWSAPSSGSWLVKGHSFGEVRAGGRDFVAGIEPMHGNELTVYRRADGKPINFRQAAELTRSVLTADLNQGHALATADLDGSGRLQIVVGWREPDKDGKVGVKIFTAQDNSGMRWDHEWVDDNGMACEDLKVADLNGDGKADIIAAGRSSHNLKVYWGR